MRFCKCNPKISLDMAYISVILHCIYFINSGFAVHDEMVAMDNSLWVSGITSRYKFHTSRYTNFAILILALGEQYSNYRKFVK